jgi:hypothetical protein
VGSLERPNERARLEHADLRVASDAMQWIFAVNARDDRLL